VEEACVAVGRGREASLYGLVLAGRQAPTYVGLMRVSIRRRLTLAGALAWVGASTLASPLRAQPAPAPSPAPAARGPVVSFSLESTAGGQTSLATKRGKVIVLFYEDREHTEDNAELKGVLVRFRSDNHLAGDVEIMPVANVSGYDFMPASNFARAAIRNVAHDIQLPILMDWRGALQARPFSLRSSASNVVVIDRSGRIVWSHAGIVSGTVRSAFFRAVRRAIRDRDGDGEPDPVVGAPRAAPPTRTAR